MTGRQLELFSQARPSERPENDSDDTRRISHYLSSRCGRPVEVVLTDNRSTMITVKRSAACKVRLHHMFADAPAEILNALAVYVKWPRHRASNATLSRYMNEKAHLIRQAPSRPLKLRTRGEYYDLRAVYDKLNREHFNGELDAPITWGRPFKGRRRRQVTFGCVDNGTGAIRINPSLDAAFVPEFFVEYIVFHEMLHCLIETRLSPDGRTLTHHSDFKRREREFPRYRDALRWQKKNLHRFLGRAR